MAKTVLIVNGDPAENLHLSEIAERFGLAVYSAGDAAAFSPNGKPAPDLVLFDLDVPSPDSLSALRKARSEFDAPIIALLDPDAKSTANDVRAAGAADILIKPISPERVESAFKDLLKIGMFETELAKVHRQLDGQPDFAEIIAVSPEMRRARTLAQRAADLDLPVLLEGEPGTGKKLFAKVIHAAGPQRDLPLKIMRFGGTGSTGVSAEDADLAALMDEAWSEAKGGTLFLEEFSDLPQPCQQTLCERLAAQSVQQFNPSDSVRLICSSSGNLIEQVKKGKFREDLYFRVNVFPIWLPPLRDRIEDIPALSQHFLSQVIAEQGKPIDEIDGPAIALLQAYVWPGNVRQLENTIFRAVALADGERLTTREFPQITSQVSGFQASAPPAAAVFPMHQRFEGPAMIGGNLPATRAITLTSFPNSAMVGIPALTEDGEIRRLDEIEADLIRLALGHYRGHITEVARRLGIGRSTLYRKMREFGLSTRHN
jgi:DNA-binding NtrC family response regulator